MFRKQPTLFQDPKIDYPIYDLHLPFSKHIELSRDFIKQTRHDLGQHPELIVDANAPFELRPADTTKPRVGALLIHGLLDSTFLMRDIAAHFQQQGVLTRALLLPGHGTVPGALLNVKDADWMQAVRYGVASLKPEVDKIILIGFSTGANLAMLHYADDPDMIESIVAISPAIKILSPLAWMTNLPPLLGKLFQRANWLHACEELDYAKYISTTFNCVYQVYRLAKRLETLSPSTWKNVPLNLLLAYEDEIVSSTATIRFFENTTHAKNRLLLYSNQKISMIDPRIQIRSSVFPEQRILGASHVCLPFSPDNSHYGRNGDFIHASHVEKEEFTYGPTNQFNDSLSRWLYQSKLAQHPMKRLSFNPDFDYFIRSILDFIENTSSQ